MKCPACGKENKDGDLYCYRCGAKLTGEDVTETIGEVDVAKPVNQKKSVFKYISFGLICLAILLMFVGWFGDTILTYTNVSYAGSSQNSLIGCGIKYYFQKGFENIKVYQSYQEPYAYNLGVTTLVINLITYIGLLVTILLCGTFAVLASGRKTFGKKYIHNPLYYVRFIFVAAFIHIGYSLMTNHGFEKANIYGATMNVGVLLGWGAILVIIGLIIAVVASYLEKLGDGWQELDVKSKISDLMHYGALAALMIAILFVSCGSLYADLNNAGQDGYVINTPYSYLSAITLRISYGASADGFALFVSALGFLFQLITLGFVVIGYFKLKHREKTTGPSFFIAGSITYLASIICGIIAGAKYYESAAMINVFLSTFAYLAFFFLAIGIALAYVSKSFFCKAKKNA